jgi:hypothetical protein
LTFTPLAHQGTPDEFAAELLVGLGIAAGYIGLRRVRAKAPRTMPRWVGWVLLGASPLVLASAVVVPTVLMKPKPPSAIRPTSSAVVSFASPSEGQHVFGDVLDVTIRLQGGKVTNTSSTTLSPDAGHLHLYVDGSLVSMAYGSLIQELPISGLAPGEHRLKVEFVAADHGPFNPPVRAFVDFVKDG